MTTLTFTGSNYGEITAQVMSFMQQIGAKLTPPQPLPNFTPETASPEHVVQTPVLSPVPAVPTATVPPQIVPAAQTSPPPATTAPTNVPDYTHDQLGRAVSGWIDKDHNNRNKALAMLQKQGVQGVTQLDTPDKRRAFAAALRAEGVQI